MLTFLSKRGKIMIVVAFACFLVLVAAWFLASNIEGTPETAVEPAPRLVETKASVEMAR
jgi:hypothetical protein